MDELNKKRAIQTICWIGVAADALWSVALVWPPFFGLLTGRPNLELDLFARLNMGIGASLMMGWTVLLGWTARKPVERRAVMLLTAFPVLAGLITVTIVGLANGNAANAWILGKCVILTVAMLFGYRMAGTMAKEAADGIDH